jgi:hypothetical protein
MRPSFAGLRLPTRPDSDGRVLSIVRTMTVPYRPSVEKDLKLNGLGITAQFWGGRL